MKAIQAIKVNDNVELQIVKLLQQARRVNTNQVCLSNVVSGLKYIVEHQHNDYLEVAQNLIKLGCTYSKKDILKQANQEEIDVRKGMKTGDIYAGAMIICQVRDYICDMSIYSQNFMKEDNEYSVYNYIRTLTGDENYTKDNVLGISENEDVKKEKEDYLEI